jgi:hypothetical protein
MVALVVALPTTAAFEEIDACAAEAVACEGEHIGYGEYSGGDAACRASLEAYYAKGQQAKERLSCESKCYGADDKDVCYECYGETHEAAKDVCCDNDECAELLNCGIEWAQDSGVERYDRAKEYTTCGSNAAPIVVIIVVVLVIIIIVAVTSRWHCANDAQPTSTVVVQQQHPPPMQAQVYMQQQHPPPMQAQVYLQQPANVIQVSGIITLHLC